MQFLCTGEWEYVLLWIAYALRYMRTITVEPSSSICAICGERCLLGHGDCMSVIPERAEWGKDLVVFIGIK